MMNQISQDISGLAVVIIDLIAGAWDAKSASRLKMMIK